MANQGKMIEKRIHIRIPTLSTIFSLPNLVIEKILQHISANSFNDLVNAKKVCKLFRKLSEVDSIYEVVELSIFRRAMKFHTTEEQRFLDKCYNENNPEAIYNKGVQDYFVHNKTVEGLHLLKHAADGRYDRAMYVYAMLQRTLGEAEESQNYIKLLTRNGIRNIRHQVMSKTNCDWKQLLPKTFVEKRDAFDSMRIILGCYCKGLGDSQPRRKKRVKVGGWGHDCLWDKCFWHIEHTFFLQHFSKHINWM